MVRTGQRAKRYEEKKEFLMQTYMKMKIIKNMKSDIIRKKDEAPKKIRKELDDWIINLDMYISLADAEIEMVENTSENKWEKFRTRVDEAIQNTERIMKKGYEILDNTMPAAA